MAEESTFSYLENIPFHDNYRKVLGELDTLYRGVYDPDDGLNTASLCLLTQASLIRIQASAELKAKSLKRDIDFAKAEAYATLKTSPPPGEKKPSEAALAQLINKDPKVHQLSMEQAVAEREAKELANILALLKDAHITFRSLAKKGE